MSDKKITDLPLASSININDVSILVNNGTDYKFAFATLLQLIGSSLNVGVNISFGTTLPQNTIGNNADVFINTLTGSFAQKISGTWTIVYTIPSATGTTDGTVLYGIGVPANTTGNNNDTYINTGTGIFYKKASGAWSQVFSMQTGPAGPSGANGTSGANGSNGLSILNGTGIPSNTSTGVNGDFYINTTNYTLFGPKTAGNWGTGISLIGDGVPIGGSAGEVLAKASNSDFDADWVDLDSIYLRSTGGALTGDVQQITGPVNANSLITKGYADNLITGLSWKHEVKAATTGSITLSGIQAIDGVSLAVNDRVLVKNQTAQKDNGIYLVQSGTWTRTTDADTSTEIGSAAVLVRKGTVNGNTQWTCINSTDPIIGTDNITFAQISGAGTYTNGTGIGLTGNTFSLDTAYTDGRYPISAFTGLGAGDILQYNGTTWQNAAIIANTPLVKSGLNLSITQADATHNGYLSSTDWNKFNGALTPDANGNVNINNNIFGYTTTATAAANTTLTVASTYLQFFTGTTTQSVLLPDATTLKVGQQFKIINYSTGALTIKLSTGLALFGTSGTVGARPVFNFPNVAIVTCTSIASNSTSSFAIENSTINLFNGANVSFGTLTASGATLLNSTLNANGGAAIGGGNTKASGTYTLNVGSNVVTVYTDRAEFFGGNAFVNSAGNIAAAVPDMSTGTLYPVYYNTTNNRFEKRNFTLVWELTHFFNFIASGTGSTTISFPHGWPGASVSSVVVVTARNAAAAGFLYATADGTNINVVYATPPPTGSFNLSFSVILKE